MRLILVGIIAAFVTVECMPRPDLPWMVGGLGSQDLDISAEADGKDSVQTGVNIVKDGEVEIKETNTTNQKTANEESQIISQGYQQTDYDNDGKKVYHNSSITQNGDENETAKSASNSTSKHEENSNGIKENKEKENNNGGADSGTSVRISNPINVINNQSSQTDQGNPGGQIGVQSGQTDNGGDTESQISIQRGRTDQGSDKKSEDIENRNIDQGVEAEAQTDIQNSQIDQGDKTRVQKNYQNSQIDQVGEIRGRTDFQNSQIDEGGETRGQIEIQSDQKNGGQAGNDVNGKMKTNNDHKFRFGQDLYRQLDRDDRALGLINDDGNSIETSGSNTDFTKLRHEYLLAVARSIHNTKIVSDGHGHAKVVTPLGTEEPRYSSTYILNVDAPYRTLAQKYGASPVSSHYANAQFIEETYRNPPSFYGKRKRDESNNTKNEYTGSSYGVGKSQYGIRNMFDRSKYGHSVSNLHLSPQEWEERARKEAEIKNAQQKSNKSKFSQGYVKKLKNIDPLVRNAILLQNLDDILKTAKTSAKISSDMKVSGQRGRISAVPENDQIFTSNSNAITFSNKNEIFGYGKDAHIGKPDYEDYQTSYDTTKNLIPQVMTNKVDLVSSNDRFDTNVISGLIMENTFDNSGIIHLDDSFDVAKARKNEEVNDALAKSSSRVISDKTNVVNSTNKENIEDSYSTTTFRTDIVKFGSEKSSFKTQENSGTKGMIEYTSETINSENFGNSNMTSTEESNVITNDAAKTMANFSSNTTGLINDDLRIANGTNKQSDFSLNESEKNYSSIVNTNLMDDSIRLQSLSSTEVFNLETNTSKNTTLKVLTDDRIELERKIGSEKANEDTSKTINIYESESAVKSQKSANNISDISSVDNNILIINDEILNVTNNTDKQETISEINEPNVTASTEVNNEFDNYNMSNYQEMDKTNINRTEISEKQLSSTQFMDKKVSINNNATNFDESDTSKSDVSVIKDSSLNISNVSTKEITEKDSEDKSVNLNKRNLEQTDAFPDNDNVIADSSNATSEIKTKPDLHSEDTSNITVLIDKSVADALFDITHTTPATDMAEPIKTEYIYDISSILNHKILSDSNVNINSSYDYSNYDKTVVSTPTTTDVYERTVTDKLNSNLESTERLYARSALESNEEYNIENTAKIDDDDNKTNDVDFDKQQDKNKSITTLDSSTYNASDITVRNEADVTTVTSNLTDVTDSFKNTNNDSNTTIEKSNVDANITANSQTFNNTVNVSNNTINIVTTGESNDTIDTTSTLDTNTPSNLNEKLPNDSKTENITSATANENDSTVKLDNKIKTTDKLNTPVDLNEENITRGENPPNFTMVGKPDDINISSKETVKLESNKDENLLDSTMVGKSDDINISSKETIKPESIKDNSNKENKGTTNYTSITADDSTSTANVNIVNQATGNWSVGDNDKTDKLITNQSEKAQISVKSNELETNIKSVKSQTNVKPVKPQVSVKSETPQVSAISEEPEASVKSEEPEASVKTEKQEASVKTETPQASVKSETPQASVKSKEPENSVKTETSQANAKSETPEASVKSEEPEASVKSEKPQAGVKSEEPEAGVKSEEPEASVRSVKPEASVKSEKPQPSVKSEKPQPSVKSEEPQASVKSEKPEASVKSEKPQAGVKSEEPEASIKSEKPETSVEFDKPQPSVKSEKPQASVISEEPEAIVRSVKPEASVKSEKPQPSVKSEKPQPSVKSEEPQAGVKSEEPEASVKSEKPESSVKSDKPQPSVKSEELQASVKSEEPQASVKTETPQANVKTESPQASIKSKTPQASVKTETSQASVKTETPQASVKTETPQASVKTETPQASVKTEIPQASVKSEKPQASVKSETPQVSVKSETTEASLKTETPQSSVKTETPQASVKTETPQSSVKSDISKSKVESDRENESRSDVEDSTSKSDESSRSVSVERLIFASGSDSVNTDYSASTSTE